jgi:hypothetical protein
MANKARSFRIGQRFMLSESGIEYYGEERWRGVTFTVGQWFDHYCEVAQMEHDPHGHPGFDGDGPWDCLYEAREPDSPRDLYEERMVPVKKEGE